MAEFSTRTIVPADGVKLPAVNENLANPSGNMTLSSLKSYVLGTLPTEVQTNTEDIGENTSDIEGIRGSSQAFDATAAYSAGDYCIYENVLYRFTSAKSAGAWDSAIVAVVDLPTLDGALTSLSGIHHTTISNSTYLRGDIDVYRIGNLVTLIFTAGAKDIQANTYNAIGTLPLGYRPPIEAQTVARSPVSSGGNLAFVVVASTGGIDFYSYVGSSGAITWTFTMTYVTADPMPN